MTNGSSKTARGNTHIMTFIDCFTGFMKTYLIPQYNVAILADRMLAYVCDIRLPIKFVKENDACFTNKVDKLLKHFLGTDVLHIALRNAQANAMVEHWHWTLKSMLWAYVNENQTNWDTLLPLLQFALNTLRNEMMKYTPHFLFFGRPPRLPLEVSASPNYKPKKLSDEYLRELQYNMVNVYELVRKHFYDHMCTGTCDNT